MKNAWKEGAFGDDRASTRTNQYDVTVHICR